VPTALRISSPHNGIHWCAFLPLARCCSVLSRSVLARDEHFGRAAAQVTGDATSALQAVLAADPERLALLAEEAALMTALNADGADAKPGLANGSGARACSSCQPARAPSGALVVV